MAWSPASKTIEVLRCLFSQFGIPHQLVSYNCPQFLFEEYKQFCEQNGIEHIFVSHTIWVPVGKQRASY